MGEQGGSGRQAARSDRDVLHPETLSPWHIGAYEAAVQALSERTRLTLRATAGPLEACRTEAIRDRHRGAACFVHLRHLDHSPLLIEVPAGLTLLLIDRALGARSIRAAISRPLRPVECGIFAHLVTQLSRRLPAHSWRVMDVHSDRSSATCEWKAEHCLMSWTIQVAIAEVERPSFDIRVWFDPIRLPVHDPLSVLLSGNTEQPVEVPCRVEVGHAWLDGSNLSQLRPGWGVPLSLGPTPRGPDGWTGDLYLSPHHDPTLLWPLRWTDMGWRLLSSLPLRTAPPWGVEKVRLSLHYQAYTLSSDAVRSPESPIELPFTVDLPSRLRVTSPNGQEGRGKLVPVAGLPVLQWEGWD